MRGMTSITKPVAVRIPAEIVARLDWLRGLVPREAYASHPLGKAISAEERQTGRRGDAR
jgi:hypothetical protein